MLDSATLGSLGLDGLDLGPANCDYSDNTVLDYLNSTCTGGAMMIAMGGGGGHAGSVVHGATGDGDDYGLPTTMWRSDELYCKAGARKPGDHQWGGGI